MEGLMDIPSEQLTNCYFHPNWDTMDQNDPFESALSSMVSSPTTTSNGCGGDGMMITELIGRLGNLRDSGDISPQSCIATPGNNSTNTSCYSTPLNSPPPSKFNLSSLLMMGSNDNTHNHANFPTGPTSLGSFNADPGFVERAAKFSCFGTARNFAELGGGVSCNNNARSGAKLESGKLSRVNSDKKMMVNTSQENDINAEVLGDSREGSSVSEQNPVGDLGKKADANSKKRKSIPKAKVKDTPSLCSDKVEAENEESDAKRSKTDMEENKKENAGGNKEEQNNDINNDSNNNDNKEAQKAEPFKDYIHVRARRGQATDSHSLAERVRREKISERMKFLQDLVPGCNKVTGKATVLDEIINYVQSLQRQVEFLSMKLATVNPRTEFNMDALLSKDMFQPRGSSMPQTIYPLDQQAFPFGYQPNQQMALPLSNSVSNGMENSFPMNPINAPGNQRNLNLPLHSIDGFADSMTQLPTYWGGDLQSLVHMGIVPNQAPSVPGTLPSSQMKVEL